MWLVAISIFTFSIIQNEDRNDMAQSVIKKRNLPFPSFIRLGFNVLQTVKLFDLFDLAHHLYITEIVIPYFYNGIHSENFIHVGIEFCGISHSRKYTQVYIAYAMVGTSLFRFNSWILSVIQEKVEKNFDGRNRHF